MTATRRLAAILAADAAGYSRLMGADEEGTLERLKAHRHELIDPKIAEHRGRVVKTTGDGILIEFPSVVDAVRCAIEMQRGMAERNAGEPEGSRIEVRIGINLGDIIIDTDDIHGDGVNIAARLEALAEPGGICISQTVLDHARGKFPFDVEDGGAQALKNIAQPVHVYRVLLGGGQRPATPLASAPALTLPDKPSIAVLPFANMSGDPEQEYFSDGITEDIITDLSKTSALSVIARNTVFTFRGKAVDTSKIAEQLNVSHIVEGSVRKAGGRVRISAQLIDGRKGDHVWAERYDRDLKDIFALQDEISQAIVAALKIKLMPAEKNAIEARSTKHPEAYELYLLGRHHYSKFNIKNVEIAVHFCQRALEIDPNYARAWALLAMCQERLRMRGKSEETGLPAAERALVLDPSLADAHAVRGLILMRLGRYDEALAAHEESLRLEPDSFDVRIHFGWTCFQLGRHEAAIEHGERAAQLLETDFLALTNVTMSYEALGRHEELISASRRALQRIEREIEAHPDNAIALALGAIELAQLGEQDRAKQWALRALANEPDDPGVQLNLGCAFARMNELEQAVDLLESCLPKMSPGYLNWMKKDPDLIPLHHHPRYRALIKRAEARLAAFQNEQTAKAD